MAAQLIEALAKASEHLSRVRFVTAAGTQETSFGALWASARRAARALRAAAPGPVAGLLIPDEAVIGCFVGALLAGRDYLSLPLPGRAQPVEAYLEQIRCILALCGARTLVVDRDLSSLCEPLRQSWPGEIVAAQAVVERAAGSNRMQIDPVPGALVQFSSGTTGSPKGVRLSGEAVLECTRAMHDRLDVRGGDVVCQWVPLSHDMGLIGGLIAAWCLPCDGRLGRAAGNYVCMTPELFLMRPLGWMELCSQTAATITTGPTFAYQVVARQLAMRPQTLDLRSLRACVVGAEPIVASTLHAFCEAAGPSGFDPRALCPGYGLAEATLAVALVAPDQAWTTREVERLGERRQLVSCGPLLGCVEVDAAACGGQEGSIRIRGPAVTRRLIPHRERAADEWLDTRDLGMLIDGELFVTGRSDDQLSLAGRNVFTWELERSLDSVPGVRAGACAVVSDDEGRYAVLFEPHEPTSSDLHATIFAVRACLVRVAGIGPSAVAAAPRGSLPKTPSGKLQRDRVKRELDARLTDSLSCIRW
ncbi:MAG TPA: AMP-binding protein [Polyangiales bacterium]|nr:AMP-binding protein [Polyangiales bacterium]